MKKITLTKFNDPGHGWLRVPLALIKKLGLEDGITKYSYVQGRYAYLEEDLDQTLFMLIAERNKIQVAVREYFTRGDSVIRHYTPWREQKDL